MLREKRTHKVKYLLHISLLLFSFITLDYAQSKDVVTIEYKNQSLRDIAKTYLSNPDYWETILRYNKLKNASNLKQGMKIKIPIGLVKSTDEKLSQVEKEISRANKNGAKIFTPKLITQAELNYNRVLRLKKQGEWQTAYDTLEDALSIAKESFRQVSIFRKSSADATISYRKGDVERRRPSERKWNEAQLFSKLYEADRARTLSNSVAEITFIDLSKIRLNENSQALIQHSRVDVLKNKTETKVKLIKGDAFAYLMTSPKKKFDIDVPGLKAIINSKSFWIEKKVVSTKIANYEGEIELSAKDVVVVVKENQGSVIPDGGVPSEPLDLLPAPQLLLPKSKKKFFQKDILFRWKSINGAKKYWLELSRDASFRNIIKSYKSLKDTSLEIPNLNLGVIYWRVCSIDKVGFPGEFSSYNYFMVSEDFTKPFLVVVSPEDMTITKSKSIFVKGETESDLELKINDIVIPTDKSGKFNYELSLTEGLNKINVFTTDQSKNSASFTRTVFYETSEPIKNIILNKNYHADKNEFVINNSQFVFMGKTRPLSHIKLFCNGIEKVSYADTSGFYSLNVTIPNSAVNLTQTIITPAGYSLSISYKIALDETPPILELYSTLPKITKENSVQLKGSVTNSDSLFVNSELVILRNNNFVKDVLLSEGKNIIDINCKDIAGNSISKRISVTKDSKPPELIKYSFIRSRRNKSEYLVKVKASDVSGLTKWISSTVLINNREEKILLMLNNNVYRKKIVVDESGANVKLLSVTLKDYVGNSKKYIIK